MDRIVTCSDRKVAAQKSEIIVTVDTVVYSIDVYCDTIEDQAGIVACLDTVLCIAVDGKSAVAGHINLRISLDLKGCAVECICDFFVLRIFIFRVFVVSEDYIARDDDLYFCFLVDGYSSAGRACQVQILKDQDHACGAFLDSDIAVRAGASDYVSSGRSDLNRVFVIRDCDVGGIFIICFQVGRAVGHSTVDNF